MATMATARGRKVTSSPFSGQAVILAFFDACGWQHAPAHAFRELRAELRGLGAMLVIVSEEGIWSFRPDDDLELSVPREELDEGRMDDLRAAYGVDAGVPAFFIIDGESKLRFSSQLTASRSPSIKMVASALSAAGRATVAEPEPEPVRNRRASQMSRVSRRELVVSSLLTVFAVALLDACNGEEGPRTPNNETPGEGSLEFDITLNVNGQARRLHIDSRVSLLDALREQCGLTGTKKGCDHGQCGACTVLIDNRRVHACLTLAVMARDSRITTIEGLARGDELHPMQAAFVECDGLQCGYCTPGQIMSAVALLHEGHATTDDEVREQMSGNICRCGAYSGIVSAIQLARGKVVPT